MIYNDDKENNNMSEKKKDFIEYLERSVRTKNTTIENFYKEHLAIVTEYGKYLGLTIKNMEEALFEKIHFDEDKAEEELTV